MASAAPEPVHSSEQNIQIPALTAPHANQQKKPKDKKAKAAPKAEAAPAPAAETTAAPAAGE